MVSEQWIEGRAAWRAGEGMDFCPYVPGTVECGDWCGGWLEMERLE